jgi:hypothetical protein
MPEFLARKVYQVALQELTEAPPLPMEELFNEGVVRYRVGTIISDAVAKFEEQFVATRQPDDPEVRITPRWSGAIWRSLNRPG